MAVATRGMYVCNERFSFPFTNFTDKNEIFFFFLFNAQNSSSPFFVSIFIIMLILAMIVHLNSAFAEILFVDLLKFC